MVNFFSNIDYPLASTYLAYSIFYSILSGFLGGSETAFLSLNRIILYAKQSKNQLSAKALIFLVNRSAMFLTGIVILNNVALILSTLYIAKMFIEAMAVPLLWVPVWTTLFITPFNLILGEVLPKSIAHPFADILSYKFVYLWIFIYIIMFPFAVFFRGLTRIVSIIGGFQDKSDESVAHSEFQGLLDISLKSGALNTGEREFINNVLDFRKIQASEAMTPLSQIVCLERSRTVEQALTLMREKEIAVAPVYDIRIDNPIGRVRAKDLVNANSNDPIHLYIQEAFFIPETAYVEKILIQMQRQNMPLAFVADEYGGIVGVLRIEDIVSEIVGEVTEEGEIDFKYEEDGTILANGLCDIDDLFESLKLDPSKVDSKTLGGFIMEKLGRMPQENDTITKKYWQFQVLSLQGRSVKEVKITKINKSKKISVE